MNMITGNCIVSPNGDRCESSDGGSGPEEGICNKSHAKTASESDNFPDLHSFVTNTFIANDPIHYSFRDNFLNDSDIGKKYIYYYNALSDFLLQEDFFDFNLLNKTIQTMPNVDEAIENILNNGENKILIDTEMLNSLIEICDIIQTKSNNESLNFIIEDLKNDMT